MPRFVALSSPTKQYTGIHEGSCRDVATCKRGYTREDLAATTLADAHMEVWEGLPEEHQPTWTISPCSCAVAAQSLHLSLSRPL